MVKLRDFPALQSFFNRHMTEGLYLLQFHKCQNSECCKPKTNLPPMVPAPIRTPEGDKYMKFDDTKNNILDGTYGKIKFTEKDCPSRMHSTEKKKLLPRYKLLANRLVLTLSCAQCGKPRCTFSMDGLITQKGQREVEDIIFSCGMALTTSSLYTATHLKFHHLLKRLFHVSAYIS